MLARRTKPRDSDPTADRKSADAGSQGRDVADNFVSGNDWKMGLIKFAIHKMQIRAAHATSGNLHQDLPWPRFRNRPFKKTECVSRSVEDHDFHACWLQSSVPFIPTAEGKQASSGLIKSKPTSCLTHVKAHPPGPSDVFDLHYIRFAQHGDSANGKTRMIFHAMTSQQQRE
jgi:hypothetical protein